MADLGPSGKGDEDRSEIIKLSGRREPHVSRMDQFRRLQHRSPKS